MGRPRKIVKEPGLEIPEGVELKDCPRCGGAAGVHKDIHGLYRCHCDECGYWDSIARNTPEEAINSWTECGNPHARENSEY